MSNHSLPILIRDLAIILMTAGLISIVFRWLKQPVVLGLVLAGVIVGPHVSWTTSVVDVENIKIWGEIGVIFVLFSLGLEFSFRRLTRVGGPATLTAVVETSLLLALGMLLGRMMGWSQMDAIFLGGMLCISSTTVIVKVFEEHGLKTRRFAQLVMGVLIVEDLVAILLLVLLSTLALTRQLSGMDLGFATLRLGFFIVLWFVVGLFLLPGFMRLIRPLLSRETTLIFAVGLCLMMVLIATRTGFSPALGAFVMGSLLAESDERERIENVLLPVRDFFAAVFFVSVGMLLDPSMLLTYWPSLIAVTLALIVGKVLAVSLGAILAGQSLGTAVRAGLTLTQIGEFSFIIAGLGLNLGVISEKLYPIAIGVSALTWFITPYMISSSDRVYREVDRRLPIRLRLAIERYHSAIQRNQNSNLFPALVRAYFPLVVINIVLILATTWFVRALVFPQLREFFGPVLMVRVGALMLNLFLCLPFFWGLGFRRPPSYFRKVISSFARAYWVEVGIVLSRAGATGVLALLIVAQYLSWRTLSGVTVGVLMGTAFLLHRFGGQIYRRLEKRFLGQFGGKLEGEDDLEPPLLPWDTHLSELVVNPESPAVGLNLERLGPQENYGVMIAAIQRGEKRILAPRGSDRIFPYDRLAVVGTDSKIESLRQLVEAKDGVQSQKSPLLLESVVIESSSPVCGRTLRESGIRDRVEGLIVGIERQGYKQLNPPAELCLEPGDRMLFFGDPE
ncbi:MAG: cation:proton antiporter, partial [Bdellovibrionales bacterium]